MRCSSRSVSSRLQHGKQGKVREQRRGAKAMWLGSTSKHCISILPVTRSHALLLLTTP